MASQDQGRARDFLGPFWAWTMIGVGLLLMASAYGLREIGVSVSLALVIFSIGALMTVAIMFYLICEGRKTWPAWFWIFHLDDSDLIMGRKKDD